MKKSALFLTINAITHAVLIGTSASTLAQGTLEEVVVTAQKRSENLQEVPIAITALSDEFIASNDIRTMEDMGASVPGLVVTNASVGAQAPISIRGLGGPSGGGSIFNDDPVGIYVDGMYIARNGLAVQDLVDIESIQVLRGPQGTLYGRNSTAGAVLITSKKPTDAFEAEVRGGYAQYNEKQLSAVVSGPLSDQVLARVAIAGRDTEGYATNIVTGDKAGNENFTARGSLRYLASDALTIDFVANHSEQESQIVTYGQAALTTLPGPFTSPIYGGNPFAQRDNFQDVMEDDKIAYDDQAYTKVDSDDAILTLNWDLGSVVLDSISGYRTLYIDATQDSDAQPNGSDYASSTDGLSLVNNYSITDADQYSQELRLSSNGDGPLQWIVGMFYIHEDIDYEVGIYNTQGGPPVPLTPGPIIPPFSGYSGTSATFNAAQTVDAYALFTDLNYQLSETLNLVVGARYSYEEKEANINQLVLRQDNNGILSALDYADSTSFNDFSPRMVLEYTPNNATLIYGSISKGFKSGGYNSFDASPAATAYPEEEILAYELGLKTDLFDNQVRLNASAFYYDYTNLQLRQAVFTGGVSIRTVDEARVQGFELESTWAPSDRLLFKANASYLDGELTKGSLNALPSNIGAITLGTQQYAPPAAFPSEDVAGNKMIRAPEYQIYLFAEYTFWQGDNINIRANVTQKFQDEMFFSETNQDTGTYRSDAWRETDLRLVVADTADNWELSIYGQNIFNERYVTQTAPFAGFPISSVNEPSKWGIQGVWRFH